MTLPNIVALQEAIKRCYDRSIAGTTVLIDGTDKACNHGHLFKADLIPAIVLQIKLDAMREIALIRLGPPGGPAPVEGGSFDWEVKPAADGVGVHFVIKSYTDDETLGKLRRQYRDILGSNHYDFR